MNLPSEPAHLPWIALSIGNSRLHWFYYEGLHLEKTWDTPHPSIARLDELPSVWEEWQQHSPALADHPSSQSPPELWIASVVPCQTSFWQTYPRAKVLTHADIPIQTPYPTFGLDRALAIWAAGTLYQWPILVIDAGTAMTYTGATSAGQCLGGGILPGLGLQLRSLNQATPALPSISLPDQLPSKWALETTSAIQSGILHTLISGMTDYIQAWLHAYSTSKIVITGGDAATLHRYLMQNDQKKLKASTLKNHIILDPFLQGEGIKQLRTLKLKADLLL